MRIRWENAVDRLIALVPEQGPSCVAITGPPASGKSTLARRLADIHGQAVVIGTDSYLPDYDTLEPQHYDLPEHAALDELADHLDSLLSGSSAEVPVWSFHSHRREGSRSVDPAPLVIVEGIHALQPQVAQRAHVRAMVEASADERLQRNIARELSGQRGWEIEPMKAFIQNIADPTFARFADEYRELADIIIENPGRPGEPG